LLLSLRGCVGCLEDGMDVQRPARRSFAAIPSFRWRNTARNRTNDLAKKLPAQMCHTRKLLRSSRRSHDSNVLTNIMKPDAASRNPPCRDVSFTLCHAHVERQTLVYSPVTHLDLAQPYPGEDAATLSSTPQHRRDGTCDISKRTWVVCHLLCRRTYDLTSTCL
jgi:hypothetical protein